MQREALCCSGHSLLRFDRASFRCKRILCAYRSARAPYQSIEVLHLPKGTLRRPEKALSCPEKVFKLSKGPVFVCERPLHTLESPIWLGKALCLTEKAVWWRENPLREKVLCRSNQALCY